MKKFILLITAILLIIGLNAQTIDKLDEKNGFKDFTLGDEYTKWQSKVEYLGNWDDGTKQYLYIGSCCNKVFNYYIDKITLRFSANKLVGIYITTENFQKASSEPGVYTEWRTVDFESIKASFTYLFGEPTMGPTEDGKITYYWTGKKVILMSDYKYLGIQKGDRQQIHVFDFNFINKEIEEGF